MSNVQQDPPRDWLEANLMFPEAYDNMSEESRQATRKWYEEDMRRAAACALDPFHDQVELIDPPGPDSVMDLMPDYSEPPLGVYPNSLEEMIYHQYLDHHYGFNQSSNPEIAA